MKVLHVIPSLGPARGGTSSAVLVIARGLAKAGVTVHVVTTDDDGRDHLAVPLNRPVQHDGVATWYFTRQTRFYTFSAPLTRWLVQHVVDFDVLHIHALFTYASIPAALIAQRRHIPYVVTPHGMLNRWGMGNRRPQLKRLSYSLIEQRILAGAAAIHYTSAQECKEAHTLGIQARAVVIPLGIEISGHESATSAERFLRNHPSLTGRTIVLFMSRLDPKKGLDLLLPAFAQVKAHHPKAALVIAGNGPDHVVKALQSRIVALHLQDSVVLAGFLAGEEKASALAASHLFVLPSYSENFGIAPVEAMAAGLPVVLTECVGVGQEVEKAEAGVLVACDVEAVAKALQRLVEDASTRRRLGNNAQSLAWERFSSDVASHRLLKLYGELLSSEKVPVS